VIGLRVARLLLGALLFLALGNSALAVPAESARFETEAQAQRYQRLVRELRCTVCQNQNLIESSAPLAADLRRQVAQMIREGQSDEQIVAYLVVRYGDFVLFRPPLQASTYLLWFGPGLLLVLGLGVLGWKLWQRRARTAPVPLSDDEYACLRRLLDDDAGGGR